ncbi:zf-HC2 domain-containing protein [Phytoactinopolyspora mesophila]|uniref:Putative zinc-finger domain-containing protein n=1 Tax=Phytoactinopolyspora mesophila TaxID=2650750 RepID=A0A7K3M960_9ACTN|nr:zf-HC2 domain-containing protein [Phytoactinopolyspora mesophila]NDL59730.1 hypothetical protein [Phytoactinopolyspora mesophila]
MKHLDDRVSDLVDDRLDHEERDRALAHLASCHHCREAVDLERYAKGVMTSLPDAEMPEQLMSKLVALAEPAGLLPRDDVPADAQIHVAPWGPDRSMRPGAAHRHSSGTGHEHRHSRTKFVDKHRRGVRAAAGGMVSTGALLVLLASLGAPANTSRDQTPATVVPPMEEFTLEHARSTGGLPFSEPASIIVPALRSIDDGVSSTPGLGTPGAGTHGFGTSGFGSGPATSGGGLAGNDASTSGDGR